MNTGQGVIIFLSFIYIYLLYSRTPTYHFGYTLPRVHRKWSGVITPYCWCKTIYTNKYYAELVPRVYVWGTVTRKRDEKKHWPIFISIIIMRFLMLSLLPRRVLFIDDAAVWEYRCSAAVLSSWHWSEEGTPYLDQHCIDV